jgi:hypothetical protein
MAVAFCGIGAIFLLTPGYGVTGTAAAMLLAQLLALILRSIEVRVTLSIGVAPIGWAKPVAALIPTAAAMLLIANLAGAYLRTNSLIGNLLFIVLVFAGIALLYSAFLYLFGIERADVATWRELTARKELTESQT